MTSFANLPEAPVYVIDDDAAVLDSTAFLLTAFGFECRIFPAANTFLAQVGELAPGCVLTDLRMPEIDGWALLAALRERAIDWPIVLMSSENGAELADRARASGFSQFVEKPIDGDKLVAAIRQMQADNGRAGGG